jgi:hypothetical protein
MVSKNYRIFVLVYLTIFSGLALFISSQLDGYPSVSTFLRGFGGLLAVFASVSSSKVCTSNLNFPFKFFRHLFESLLMSLSPLHAFLFLRGDGSAFIYFLLDFLGCNPFHYFDFFFLCYCTEYFSARNYLACTSVDVYNLAFFDRVRESKALEGLGSSVIEESIRKVAVFEKCKGLGS